MIGMIDKANVAETKWTKGESSRGLISKFMGKGVAILNLRENCKGSSFYLDHWQTLENLEQRGDELYLKRIALDALWG